MTRRIYLAGPMTGYEEHNYPAFRYVANQLRQLGHYVYSPHEHYGPEEPGAYVLRQAFADYSRFICLSADTIVLLPGWKNSKGAMVEHGLAICCGLDVIEWLDDLFCQDEVQSPPRCKPMPDLHTRVAGYSDAAPFANDYTKGGYPLPLHKGAVQEE